MKRLCLAIFLIHVAAFLSHGQTDASHKTAEEQFKRGVKLLRLNNAQGALVELTKSIVLRPDYARAYSFRSQAYFLLGRSKESEADADLALVIINKAIEKNPNHAQHYLDRAYIRRGDEKQVLADLDKAISLDPRNAEAFAKRGAWYTGYPSKDLEKELANFDQAILLDPNRPEFYVERGRARIQKKDRAGVVSDSDKAVALYTKAIEADPVDAAAYFDRAWARGVKLDLIQMYQIKEPAARKSFLEASIADLTATIEDYTRALELNPRFWEGPLRLVSAYIDRGIARFDNEDFAGAFADFDKAIVLMPDFINGYRARADARAKRGDLGEAIADLTKAIELQSKEEDAWSKAYLYVDRGRIRLKQKDYEAAISDFNKADEFDSKSPTALLEIAEVRLAQGDLEAAAGQYSKALERAPDWAGIWARRGLVRLRQNRDAEAETDFQKALQINPGVQKLIDTEREKIRPKPPAKTTRPRRT